MLVDLVGFHEAHDAHVPDAGVLARRVQLQRNEPPAQVVQAAMFHQKSDLRMTPFYMHICSCCLERPLIITCTDGARRDARLEAPSMSTLQRVPDEDNLALLGLQHRGLTGRLNISAEPEQTLAVSRLHSF